MLGPDIKARLRMSLPLIWFAAPLRYYWYFLVRTPSFLPSQTGTGIGQFRWISQRKEGILLRSEVPIPVFGGSSCLWILLSSFGVSIHVFDNSLHEQTLCRRVGGRTMFPYGATLSSLELPLGLSVR